MQYLLKNIDILEERIALACQKYQRHRKNIEVVFVSKNTDVAKMIYLHQRGYSHFGENRVLDGLSKYEHFLDLQNNLAPVSSKNSTNSTDTVSATLPNISFIGHLQSNKINAVLKYASLIQSIDRLSIALELEKKLILQKRDLNILIQVNTSEEKNKSGADLDNVLELVENIKTQCPHLQIKGLMTISHIDLEEQKTHRCFRSLKGIQEEIKKNDTRIDYDILSMGMSKDLEIAIAEGSTMLRVGRDVFLEK